MKRINIGCGNNTRKGYINIDIKKLKNVDLVMDLNKFPYPLKKRYYSEILAENIIEHLDDLPNVFSELHSLLIKGGKLIVRVPHFTSTGDINDPTHKHHFGIKTLECFSKNYKNNYYFNCGFEDIKSKIIFGKKFAIWNYLIEPIVNLFPIIYENTPLRIFPAEEIEVVLTK